MVWIFLKNQLSSMWASTVIYSLSNV
jgi:hypothetical protein